MKKSIQILESANVAVSSFEQVRHVQKNLFAYHPTQRGEMVDGSGAWASTRDFTINLSDFEATAFRIVGQVVAVPVFCM